MNQRILIMICLKFILILQHLLFCQKKKLFETKDKKKNNDFEELIQVKWSNLKDEIEKMSKEEIENEEQDKILKILKKSLILIKKFKNNQDKD